MYLGYLVAQVLELIVLFLVEDPVLLSYPFDLAWKQVILQAIGSNSEGWTNRQMSFEVRARRKAMRCTRVKLWDEEQHYIVIICFVRFQKSTFKGVKLDYRLGNRGGGEQTI